ncbi:MAG: hypothetical protein J6B70_02545 [Oscillospiraceae bacterium]|nr:hypothetical protein [Oscillospiraceae bacterium]
MCSFFLFFAAVRPPDNVRKSVRHIHVYGIGNGPGVLLHGVPGYFAVGVHPVVKVIQHPGEFHGVTLGIGGGHELSGLLLHGVPVQDEVLVPALLDLHQLTQVVRFLLQLLILGCQPVNLAVLPGAGGVPNVLLSRIKALAKRNYFTGIIICNSVSKLHLIGLPYYIAQSTAHGFPVYHIASFIQNDAVIWQVILVYEVRNIIPVCPVRKSILLKRTHTIFHACLFKKSTNSRNSRIKRVFHLHIGGIQGFLLTSFCVTLGVFFVLSEILPVPEHGKTAAFF